MNFLFLFTRLSLLYCTLYTYLHLSHENIKHLTLYFFYFFLFAVVVSFWAITRPLRYRTYISKRRLFIAIVVIWFASAAISFIPIFSGWYHAAGPINVFTLKNSNDCGLDVSRNAIRRKRGGVFCCFFVLLCVISLKKKSLKHTLRRSFLSLLSFSPLHLTALLGTFFRLALLTKL